MARELGTHNGSGSHGDRGSDGGPGGALARGRGRLQGPPGGPRSGAPFLLAPVPPSQGWWWRPLGRGDPPQVVVGGSEVGPG